MSPSFQQLLPLLAKHEVQFIIIGGIAGMAHGAARATYDIDVVYARSGEYQAPDLLGEVAGGGFYDELLPFSEELEAFGTKCRVVGLEKLIQLKRAAGRPKDFEAIAELQALLDERGKANRSPLRPS